MCRVREGGVPFPLGWRRGLSWPMLAPMMTQDSNELFPGLPPGVLCVEHVLLRTP